MKQRKPTHPGELLQRLYLDEMNMTQTELAEKIGCRHAQVNLIINGKRGISPLFALELERVLKVDAETWLNLQMKYDLWEARHQFKREA
jgi:addiction module HigA family antidote